MTLEEIWAYIWTHKIGALAAYGALLSTANFFFGLYLNNKDKAKIVVSYQKNGRIAGDPKRKDIVYTRITVVNHGRRPAKIAQVFYRYFSGESFVLIDSIHENKNKVLTEENPSVYFLSEQKEIDFDQVWYVGAFDARNIEYKTYVASLPRRALEAIKRPFNNKFMK